MLQMQGYVLHPNCNLLVTRPRFYDVKYVQLFFRLHNVGANGSVLNIPISPPLERVFQIFQIRMVCESARSEYSIHMNPYSECRAVDWLFKHTTEENDETFNEVWIVKPDNICVAPYLYLSFKELSGTDPGMISFEMRITD